MASPADLTEFWRHTADGLLVAVKAQPKSRRPGIGGVAPCADGPRLRIAVTDAPENGRANRAVCEMLADALGLPRSAVTLAAGATSRDKRLQVAGDPATLIARISTL